MTSYQIKAHNELSLDKLASSKEYWEDDDLPETESFPLSYQRMAEIFKQTWDKFEQNRKPWASWFGKLS